MLGSSGLFGLFISYRVILCSKGLGVIWVIRVIKSYATFIRAIRATELGVVRVIRVL